MRVTGETAQHYAVFWCSLKLHKEGVPEWERLRSWIDGQTFGELDCQPLDIMTDMVLRRIKVRSKPGS